MIEESISHIISKLVIGQNFSSKFRNFRIMAENILIHHICMCSRCSETLSNTFDLNHIKIAISERFLVHYITIIDIHTQ